VAGLASFQFIPKSFFPQSPRPEILVDMWLPEGTAIEEVERQAKRLEAKIATDPDQTFFATYIGEGIPRFFLPLDQQLPNPNFAQIMIMSKGGEARERLIARLRTTLHDEFPAVRSKVDRLFLGPPVGWAVQMRVIGPDVDKVRQIAGEVRQRFQRDGRISTIHDDWLEPVTEMQLVIDQDRARALGVTSQMVRQAINTAVSGAVVGSFRDGEETVGVVVRERSADRDLLSAVQSLYIPTNLGTVVPVSQVAHVVPALVQGIEWRRDRLPTITVRGVVADGLEGSDVGTKLYQEMGDLIASLPAGYAIQQQGGAEESATSQRSIAAKAPLMLLVILCLLMVQLQHFGKAMLVLATGPLGIIGAAAALLITQAPFGFVAILGVIALLGIIIRNSIILVDQIDQDIATGMARENAIVGAAVRRFRPIVLTAMTAVLALIPISRGLFWGPMAFAMMGGILVATVLTIFVLPACYALFFGREPKSDMGHHLANDRDVPTQDVKPVAAE